MAYADGSTNHAAGTYETTAYDGEWLHFPSNRRFAFKHGLGTTNYSIAAAFVSFSSRPAPAGDENATDISQAAGDMLIIEKRDASELVVRNDTCSDLYLYVKLRTDGDYLPDAGAATP